MTFKAYGDSITYGVGASPQSNCWVGLFNPVNAGVSSSQAADLSGIIQAETPDVSKLYFVAIGANDAAKYKDDATKKEFFRRTYRACLAWLKLPDKKTGRGPQAAITFTGTWTDSPSPNTCGKYTMQQGATGTATVSGDTVYVALSEGDYVSMGESINVTIDGIDKGTYSVKYSGVTTFLNQWWARSVWKFTGLGAGNHTVVVTQNSPSGKFLHLDYIAGSDQPISPRVIVGNAMKFTDSYYASLGINATTTQAYNEIISEVCAEFGVEVVDNFSDFNPAIHSSDQYGHPNNAGYLMMHNNFMEALLA